MPFCTAAQLPQKVNKDQMQAIQKTPSFYLKTNPLQWIQGPIPLVAEYGGSLEGTVTSKFSYQLSGGFLNKSILFNLTQNANGTSPRDLSFNGYRFQFQVRYYPFEKKEISDTPEAMVPNGFYIAGNASYANATLKLKSLAYPRTEFENSNITLVTGYQMMASNRFGLEYFMQLGLKRNTLFETDYQLNRTQLNLEDYGMSSYYSSNFKIGFGFNVTFGLF